MGNDNDKVHEENRLRRMADRQGLRLAKSRARDPNSVTYGGYMLVELGTDRIVFGTGVLHRGFSASLKDIARYLTT